MSCRPPASLANPTADSPPLKTRFIINLRSGRARGALPLVRTFAARRSADVVLTERTRHAFDLAARAVAENCALVVAVGGDGTMNEVASALIGTGVTFGLVPCGSGDGLGRHLRIHGSVARALAILESGQPRLIDSALADGHPFFTVAGVGFEAEVSQRFNRLQRRGFLRYLTTSAAASRHAHALDYIIEHGGRRESIRAFTLAVANSSQYGNGARIAPAALIDDGLLDLCAVRITPLNLLPLAAGLFTGTLARIGGVTCRRAERFVIERPAAGLLQTDGEVHEAGTRIEFVVRPGSLQVMCPH